MAAVLREVVREYLPKKAHSPKHRDLLEKQEEAKRWIFEDGRESSEYVFGFRFICSYLGVCPARVRRAIRRLEYGDARRSLYSELADVEVDHGRTSPANPI